MANSLTRDFTTTPTNAKKFTVSFWLKKTNFTSNQIMLCNYGNNGSDDFQIQLRNDDTLGILDYKSGSVVANHETTRKFQDTTSWYHIVIAGDSTQSTAANRLRLYVNGLEETSWASLSSITQDAD
ncbi:LamG-like jellyroll fold domain-containing protein, partial [Marinobacter sp.]|uniref:LamG-like jellyroll fold domain-containing protein n=1 Tax=Marinobacter sp. TaxID=50741 RepID=UPI000C8FE1AD